MTAKTTSPLRPPRARQSELARWLQSRTQTIRDVWMARVRAYPPSASGQPLPPPADAPLSALYDDLCLGLDTGRFTAFDEDVKSLTREGFQRGYRLSDLLYIVMALSDQACEACMAEFLPERALSLTRTLYLTFNAALALAARTYGEENQAAAASELESAQWRLAQLDRAKSSFINIAAHELRTPITLIQGYSDILTQDLAESGSERSRQVANGLATGAKRLLQIVNDMIAVSQIDNEMLALHFQPTSVLHVIQIVVSDLKSDMSDRDVAIEVQPPTAPIGAIYADPQRLYDALMHVVGNAVKYTPDGGHVHIALRVLHVKGEPEPILEITVADDGIGIAPEHRERIFEKFSGTTDAMRHSSGRTKFKGGGPGLGLVVTKGILEAHGGKIWAESPGYDEVRRPGTTVFILLPMRVRLPAAAERLNISLDGPQGGPT